MAAPNYSPSGGKGTTYNDSQSGITYLFDGSQWSPISSGATQAPMTYAPVGSAPTTQTTTTPTTNNNTSSFNAKDPNANPGDGYFWDAADGWKKASSGSDNNQAIQDEINNIYSGLGDYYNKLRSTLSNQLPSVLQEAQSAYDANKATLDTGKQQALDSLGQQTEQAQQARQAAENEQRRLYEELSTGGVQRFGGGSSAGQAYNELLGVEQQRARAAQAQQYQNAINEIGATKTALEQNYNNQLLQLQNQLQSNKNQIQRDYQDKLSQIDSMQAQSEQEKSQMKLQALQQLREQAYQLELQNNEYAQQLKLQYAQQSSGLDNYLSSLSNELLSTGAGVDAYANLQSPTSDLALSGTNTSTSPQSLYTGAITSSNKDEEQGLLGNVLQGASSAYNALNNSALNNFNQTLFNPIQSAYNYFTQ